MTHEQIKYMAEQFLRWKLPTNFNPDCGITFSPTYRNGTPQGGKHEPTGTNLWGYTEAEQMVKHMLDGMPG